jgi:hypothetical protein
VGRDGFIASARDAVKHAPFFGDCCARAKARRVAEERFGYAVFVGKHNELLAEAPECFAADTMAPEDP